MDRRMRQRHAMKSARWLSYTICVSGIPPVWHPLMSEDMSEDICWKSWFLSPFFSKGLVQPKIQKTSFKVKWNRKLVCMEAKIFFCLLLYILTCTMPILSGVAIWIAIVKYHCVKIAYRVWCNVFDTMCDLFQLSITECSESPAQIN